MLDNHEVGQQKARIVEAMGFAGPVVTPSAVKFCCPAHIFDILFYTLIIRLFSPPRRIKLFDREEKRSTSSSSRPQSWCGHSRMPSRWILQSSPMPSNVGYVRGVFLVKGNASLWDELSVRRSVSSSRPQSWCGHSKTPSRGSYSQLQCHQMSGTVRWEQ